MKAWLRTAEGDPIGLIDMSTWIVLPGVIRWNGRTFVLSSDAKRVREVDYFESSVWIAAPEVVRTRIPAAALMGS